MYIVEKFVNHCFRPCGGAARLESAQHLAEKDAREKLVWEQKEEGLYAKKPFDVVLIEYIIREI